MTTYARIAGGVVAELMATTGPVPECHPDLGTWRDASSAPPQLAPGWTFDGTSYNAPVQSLPQAQDAALTAAQAHCDGLLAAGYTYGGNTFRCDAAAQIDINAEGSLALAALAQPDIAPWAGTGWYDVSGVNRPFDAPTFIAFAHAVGSFVKGCYLNLVSIQRAIMTAGSVAVVQAIDVTSGYPTAHN